MSAKQPGLLQTSHYLLIYYFPPPPPRHLEKIKFPPQSSIIRLPFLFLTPPPLQQEAEEEWPEQQQSQTIASNSPFVCTPIVSQSRVSRGGLKIKGQSGLREQVV